MIFLHSQGIITVMRSWLEIHRDFKQINTVRGPSVRQVHS